MYLYKYFLAVLLMAFSIGKNLYAQELCGSDLVHQRLLEQDPEYQKRLENFEKLWQEMQLRKGKINVIGNDTSYEIPVVIHVIHTGGAINSSYNPADSQLVNWVHYLNTVLSATYPSYPNTSNGGVAFPIKFTLAKRDTNCNATTGIVRVNASALTGYASNGLNLNNSNGISENALRALSRWNPNAYYNIYVVNKIDGKDGITSSGTYTAGFAYYPSSGSSVDGAYMLASVAKTGRSTLPHEIGHAMGLMHTFEGGNASTCPPNTNCLTDGDKVCDTEPVRNLLSVSPCVTNSQTNPCTGAQYHFGQNNIMGYGSCLNRFTAGQRERAMLQLKTYRGGQMTSMAVLNPGLSVKPASCSPTMNNPGNTFGIGPCHVMLNDMMYTSGGYGADGNRVYKDNSCQMQTVIKPNDSSMLSVTTTTNPQKVVAYIDYNNNGVFESSERILNSSGTIASQTHSIKFKPPVNAVKDTPLRMRVIADWANITGPCTALTYGQAEDFGVFISNNNPLPVKLISFNAIAYDKRKNITLSWKTAEETGVDLFELQRSDDGENYTTIQIVKSQGSPSSYSYIDDQVEWLKAYYYRLKWTNVDGSAAYSLATMAIINRAETAINLFPNPVSTNEVKFRLKTIPVNASFILTDLSGKVVVRVAIKQQEGTIYLHDLANGVYFASFEEAGIKSEKQKLILQR